MRWALEEAAKFLLTGTIVAVVMVIANDVRWRYLHWRLKRKREKREGRWWE